MTSIAAGSADRTCHRTGLGLVAADGTDAWRIAKDQYVATSGVAGVLVNDRIGPLPHDVPDRRGRYDTLGRTVYVADSPTTAIAEVLQPFRSRALALANDAAAIGADAEVYRRRVTAELHERGLPGPGEIPADWHLARSLCRVQLPQTGWWVLIDCAATLNALSDAIHGTGGQLTIGHVCGDNRVLTTQLAQLIRDSTLDDGTMPLGVAFPSKTAYGRCWAWWNRTADANTNPGGNDMKLLESTNVGGTETQELCTEWGLTFTV